MDAQEAEEAKKQLIEGDGYVWIDSDLCTGDGLCVEIDGKKDDGTFGMGDDGIAFVRENGKPLGHPLGSQEPRASVPPDHLNRVVESAEECPGECIFIEVGGRNGQRAAPVPLEVSLDAVGRG